jgi:hypothetical protein
MNCDGGKMTSDQNLKRVQFNKDDIGIMLLESITQGLYHDPLNSIREYVQNEYDSSAEQIDITASGDNITITGNGSGMSKEELLEARKLGFSTKNPSYNVGFRGIGIWSGVAICDEIFISTKRKDNPTGWVLRIDASGLRSDMLHSRIPLISALSNRVYYGESSRDEFKAKHGTRVELRGILPQYRNLLDMDNLISYVRQILPVRIDPDYSYSGEIERRLKEVVADYRTIGISVNGKKVYRPPLKGIDSYPPIFETLKNSKKQPIGFAWYSICQNAIDDLQSRHPILKKKGFTIGDPSRSKLVILKPFDRPALTRTTGEIHILDDNLYPTSERTDIETNAAYIEFENCTKKLLDDISRTVREYQANAKLTDRFIECAEIRSKFDKAKEQEEKFDIYVQARLLRKLLDNDLKDSRIDQKQIKKIKSVKKCLSKDLSYMDGIFDAFASKTPSETTTTGTEEKGTTPKRKRQKREEPIPIEAYKAKIDAVITPDQHSMRIIASTLRAVSRLLSKKKEATIDKFVEYFIEEFKKG